MQFAYCLKNSYNNLSRPGHVVRAWTVGPRPRQNVWAIIEHRVKKCDLALWSQGVLVTFDQFTLDPRLYAGIQAMGYKTPTPIQQRAIPVVLEGRDVLGLAQTGTGKTAAFILPTLQRLTRGKLGRVRALIVAPTRELAEQIHQESRRLAKKTPVRSTTVYGGVSKQRQVEALRRGVEIVVACPGRLLDLHGDRCIDLSQVEVLVLDEADRMCDMGFLPDIRRILRLLPRERQTLFFSATMPQEIRELADTILDDPETIQVDAIAPAKTVSHALYPVSNGRKKNLLLTTLEQTATGRVLIFCRTKRRARALATDLDKKGYRASALQGNMSQNARQRAIDGFRKGRYDILVATDVASRGIDVSDISHVINYDMPDTVDAYTHRIGRTGRAHKSGEAFTFMGQEDEKLVRQIEKLLGTSIERRLVDGFDYGPVTVERSSGSNGSSRDRGQPYRGQKSRKQRSYNPRSRGARTRSQSSQSQPSQSRRPQPQQSVGTPRSG
jgi:ATP-dependent RNA helicase RhlE